MLCLLHEIEKKLSINNFCLNKREKRSFMKSVFAFSYIVHKDVKLKNVFKPVVPMRPNRKLKLIENLPDCNLLDFNCYLVF